MFDNALIPAGSYMFKVNNRNTSAKCEICSKLTIKIPKRRHCPCKYNLEQDFDIRSLSPVLENICTF